MFFQFGFAVFREKPKWQGENQNTGENVAQGVGKHNPEIIADADRFQSARGEKGKRALAHAGDGVFVTRRDKGCQREENNHKLRRERGKTMG